jgi:hypothetical protein
MAIRLAGEMLDEPKETVLGTIFDLTAGRISR